MIPIVILIDGGMTRIKTIHDVFFVLSSQRVNTGIISDKTPAEYFYTFSVGLEIEV